MIFNYDVSELQTAVTALENEVNTFEQIGLDNTGTLETLCPYDENAGDYDKLHIYRVASDCVTDLPAASGVNWSARKYLYVFVFGSSNNNHMHYVIPSATDGVIGRVFIKITRGGVESWKELMYGDVDAAPTYTTLTLTDVATNISAYATAQGKVVNVVGNYTDDVAKNGGWTPLCTLPAGYRPSAQIFFVGVNNIVGDMPYMYRINTSGVVAVYINGDGPIKPRFCFTFIV